MFKQCKFTTKKLNTMSKSTLILEDLKDALQCWEDENMYSEVLFQLSNFLGAKGLPRFYTKPLVGTEVDDVQVIRRAIKNFHGFRYLVENHMEITDPTLFLPRVPKDEREEHPGKLDFFRRHLVHGFPFFPFLLSRWIEFKKVFVMENLNLIKSVNVYEKNYLDKLPYGSFILKLNEPVKKIFHNTGTEREFGTILIASDGIVIDLLFIQSNVKEWCMSSESRKLLQNISFKKMKDLLKQFKKIPLYNPDMKCEGFSIEIASGLKWIGNEKGPGNTLLEYRWDLSQEKPKLATRANGQFFPKKNSEADTPEVIDILNFQKRMINILNGFCKFVSEIPAEQRNLVLGDSTFTPPPSHDLTEWNAIPITNVFYLHENVDETTNEKVLVLYHGGGEKSPHWRRGHYRTRPDGTRVWIDKILVRKDKLETEHLKGNVTVVKDQ